MNISIWQAVNQTALFDFQIMRDSDTQTQFPLPIIQIIRNIKYKIQIIV